MLKEPSEQEQELVSVVIPVFNYGCYLAEAIDSVLSQSYNPIEIIVVNDGSTDNSSEIANSYPDIIYLYQPNQGVATARNTGLSNARGKFIAFLDADDTWHPEKIKKQVGHLLSHPSVGFNITRIKNFYQPGVIIPSGVNRAQLDKEQIALGSIVARKEVFNKIGSFNTQYTVAEDFEWFARTKEMEIPMTILPDVLLFRRIHDSNISLGNPEMCQENRLKIFKESMDRRHKQKNCK